MRPNGNDDIEVKSTTLDCLFSGALGTLNIPEYQRPYRWGSVQLERLLNDLVRHFSCSPAPEHDFYLGSIILHRTDRGRDTLLDIIDGQQRITSLGLLAHELGLSPQLELRYTAPLSQQNIHNNLQWLEEQKGLPQQLDLARINITLVITRSRDDAYRFFETQNTGGVRLTGPQIIKAHHLRVIDSPDQQDRYARLWEGLEEQDQLSSVITSALKARWCNKLAPRSLPRRRDATGLRDAIFAEFGESTGRSTEDNAYSQVRLTHALTGWNQQFPAAGYAIRQPLNAGINSIHYLQSFCHWRQRLFTKGPDPELKDFHSLYDTLISLLDDKHFLTPLFETAVMTYTSHLGTERLYEVSLWLFRVIYSKRLTNDKAVRESSADSFITQTPVYDWLLASFTPEQCIERLSAFNYTVSMENLGEKDSGVKARFFAVTSAYFEKITGTPLDKSDYDRSLTQAIARALAPQATGKADNHD